MAAIRGRRECQVTQWSTEHKTQRRQGQESEGDIDLGGQGVRDHKSDASACGDIKKKRNGTSLVAQWLRLLAPKAGGSGSISGQGTRIHMPQQRSEIRSATRKPPRNQINTF